MNLLNNYFRNFENLMNDPQYHLKENTIMNDNAAEKNFTKYTFQLYKKEYLRGAMRNLEKLIDGLKPKIDDKVEGWEDLEAFSDKIEGIWDQLSDCDPEIYSATLFWGLKGEWTRGN